MVRSVFSSIFMVLCVFAAQNGYAYNHADTLRGGNGRGRDWWDVRKYHLYVKFDFPNKSINGSNQILFKVTGTPHDSMQIDLQGPLVLDSVVVTPSIYSSILVKATFEQEGNVWWVKHPFSKMKKDSLYSVKLFYHGEPRKAVNPPWDGGFSWKKDSLDRPWVAVSCQGLGASVWWPCKDAQWDEPEDGMRIGLETPKGLQAVSNGRMASSGSGETSTNTIWQVRNPINNYDVSFYIGNYVH